MNSPLDVGAPPPPTDKSDESARKLFTFSSGGWVLLLACVLTLLAAGLVLYPVWATGFHPAIGDGQHVDTYGFDLSRLTIPREQLVASGYPKDGVRAVPEMLIETVTPPEVDLIAKNEHIRFLTPSDLVIGVRIGNESRAYPVRILNLHEVVNDKVGGVPIAVTWGVLSGSAAVFDRRLDGTDAKPVEFGVSGLLYNANLVMFDRRAETKDESLWPQLGFRAVSGPAAGIRLTLIDCALTTWKAWREEHPETRVFLGLRTLKSQYGDAQDPFNMYAATDEVKFPFLPVSPGKELPKKTPLVLSLGDGERWRAEIRKDAVGTTSQPAREAGTRVYSYLFAWYAQHSGDTDYAGIEGK